MAANFNLSIRVRVTSFLNAPERCRDGRDDLSDQPVQVGVRGTVQAQVLEAKLVNSLKKSHLNKLNLESIQ